MTFTAGHRAQDSPEPEEHECSGVEARADNCVEYAFLLLTANGAFPAVFAARRLNVASTRRKRIIKPRAHSGACLLATQHLRPAGLRRLRWAGWLPGAGARRLLHVEDGRPEVGVGSLFRRRVLVPSLKIHAFCLIGPVHPLPDILQLPPDPEVKVDHVLLVAGIKQVQPVRDTLPPPLDQRVEDVFLRPPLVQAEHVRPRHDLGRPVRGPLEVVHPLASRHDDRVPLVQCDSKEVKRERVPS